MTIIPEELLEHIRNEAKDAGYQLVDIISRGGSGVLIEIVMDKEGGITIDECSSFNRKILSWIEDSAVISSAYILDVCSPGLDRPLKTENDYKWAEGKQIEIIMNEPVDGKNNLIGKLLESEEDSCIVVEETEGNFVRVSKTNVAKARLKVCI
ncbi:MAG: hypothetical protein P9L88_04070 [Candidatus Tantalella remota]|nr:hypothetical protein [Candidatus Tantalella remota]